MCKYVGLYGNKLQSSCMHFTCIKRRRSLLSSVIWFSGGGAHVTMSTMVTPEDGGQQISMVRGKRTEGGRALAMGLILSRCAWSGHGCCTCYFKVIYDGSWRLLGLSGSTRSHGAAVPGMVVWPTLPPELVGRLNKGGGPRVFLAPRQRAA
jgi:hypothetical protein